MKTDLFNFEQHRDTFISYFRRTNISFTNSDVDTLIQELQSIYEDLEPPPRKELSEVRDQLDAMSASLQDRFPIIASMLSVGLFLFYRYILLNIDIFILSFDTLALYGSHIFHLCESVNQNQLLNINISY